MYSISDIPWVGQEVSGYSTSNTRGRTSVESYKENCKFVLCTALVISRGLGKRFAVILLLIRGVEPVLKAIRKIVSLYYVQH